MAQKPSGKKGKKKEGSNPNRWPLILLAVFFVVVMVIVPFYYAMQSPVKNQPGGQDANTFGSLADALQLLPSGAQYVRYADLNASGLIANWTMTNLQTSVPNLTTDGAQQVRKDAIASYPFPALGYTTESTQVVSLSDFGPGFDNTSLTTVNVNGYPVRSVDGTHGFSIGKDPVISGRLEYVGAIESYEAQATVANSAYASYADLFDQIASYPQTVKDAKFAIAGASSDMSLGDRYYAGVTPLNDTTSDYKIVMHLTAPLNATQMADYDATWQAAALQYGFLSFSPHFTDNYLVVDAVGSTETCLYDLYDNWPGMLKG